MAGWRTDLVLESAAGEPGPSGYYVDANTAGEGLIVDCWAWIPSFNG